MKTAKIFCCLALLLSLIFAYGYATNGSQTEAPAADTTASAETTAAPEAPAEMPAGEAANGEVPDGQMPQNNMSDGTMPEGGMPEGGMPGGRMARSGMGGGTRPEPPADFQPPSAGETPPAASGQADSDTALEDEMPTRPENGTMPEDMQGMPPFDGQRADSGMGGPMAAEAAAAVSNPFLTFLKSNFTPISAVILLAAGFCFAIFYKRKTY